MEIRLISSSSSPELSFSMDKRQAAHAAGTKSIGERKSPVPALETRLRFTNKGRSMSCEYSTELTASVGILIACCKNHKAEDWIQEDFLLPEISDRAILERVQADLSAQPNFPED